MNKKKDKLYRFFLHYNKPLSKQLGEHYWSVHFRNNCMFTREVICTLPTHSKTNKRQPYVVMQGMAKRVTGGKDLLIIS